ncbi:MAG: hypothetical protein C0490_23900 [Marivirga sp.]|nr:hypothetical protein [Marivirga sp.]
MGALAFSKRELYQLQRTGQRHSLEGFGRVLECAAFAMCVAAAWAKAIGIEMKSPKCVGRSEDGLVMKSPGRRHCHICQKIYYLVWETQWL